MPARTPDTVVFDLGGVLFDWDPRHLYRTVFAETDAMERFLAEVCTPAWNALQDRGRGFAEAIAELQREHPAQADRIALYFDRWPDMLAGTIPGTVRVLEELKGRGVPLHAITNWSHETIHHAKAFPFMAAFGTVVVSGEERVAKPEPAIYRLLLERIGRPADACVFIDDVEHNVDGARAVGMTGIRFTTPEALRAELARLDLLD
ncbi:HAD family hydrolase [Marinivivus vitaminiproducens]|uniref:HAD family hydrolase n=1 Tax=Marinivivus vitaminiproducens TaxID=3035935 RepID=UPI0027A0E601|nr:HAD family phosphatase [Geminicoccaceae bacterium SCSIO 64248]